MKNDTNILKRLTRSLRVRMSLIIVVVTALLLEGVGLVQYLYLKKESSDPAALNIFVILLIVGFLLAILLVVRALRNMKRLGALSASNQKMENELHIASEIQMSMLPKLFPPYPERADVDMYASMIPAKEVGGDLYDFYVRDNKFFFCIGDVSGKGVPASLVMAVTRSLFRTVSMHEKSPQRIVTVMNESMSDMNESDMFVTFFAAVLDLCSGHLRYCNAGHNVPYLITGESTRSLDAVPNIPLGVEQDYQYVEQETDIACGEGIFLYTDGLTEAENTNLDLFGEKRLFSHLKGGLPARQQVESVISAVEGFTGGASRSDDLTMLYIRYMNESPLEGSERHLILHNDIQQIPQLAGFVEEITESIHLDQQTVMSLNLALEEAVSNVILYAYPKGSSGIVDIEAIVRKDKVDFIITDNGVPFDPTNAPDVDVTLGVEERQIGGLGIYLVRTIMDSVSYKREEGKNILSMTKNI